MRFEHGTLRRPECLILLILLLSATSAVPPPPPFHQQCLPLVEGVGPGEACGGGPARPQVRLRFCDAYEPARLLAACDEAGLASLRALDAEARAAACRFNQLLDRYDCENTNSVSWTCQDCQNAYKQWVCAMYLPPLQMDGEGVKPCRYICHMVEQKCPYFHPSVKDQYAGERVFKCIDPDIPDLASIRTVSAYGPSHRCYCPNHLTGGHINNGSASECRFLTPAELRRNAERNEADRPSSSSLVLLLLVLAAYRWTRTTR